MRAGALLSDDIPSASEAGPDLLDIPSPKEIQKRGTVAATVLSSRAYGVSCKLDGGKWGNRCGVVSILPRVRRLKAQNHQ